MTDDIKSLKHVKFILSVVLYSILSFFFVLFVILFGFSYTMFACFLVACIIVGAPFGIFIKKYKDRIDYIQTVSDNEKIRIKTRVGDYDK